MPTLRNRRTGETVFVPDNPAPRGGVYQPATAPFQVPQAAANVENTRAQTNAANARTAVMQRDTALKEREFERDSRRAPLSPQDQTFINSLREQAAAMPELAGRITTAAKAVDRFKPTPGRGQAFNMTYPEANDYPITALSKTIGRAFQSPESERDYQTLRAMQEGLVLNTQQAQKGPQTESDAARMKAANISPTLSVEANALLAADALFNAKMAEKKPDFYTKWANHHGSLGTLGKDGRSVDQAWAETYQRGLNKLRSDPRYSRLTQKSGGTKNAPAGGEFLGWED